MVFWRDLWNSVSPIRTRDNTYWKLRLLGIHSIRTLRNLWEGVTSQILYPADNNRSEMAARIINFDLFAMGLSYWSLRSFIFVSCAFSHGWSPVVCKYLTHSLVSLLSPVVHLSFSYSDIPSVIQVQLACGGVILGENKCTRVVPNRRNSFLIERPWRGINDVDVLKKATAPPS